MLNWDRTSFDQGARKTFHIVDSSSTIYDELCAKYGADQVLRASSTAANAAFTSAIALCEDDGGDIIYVYPGSYTFAAGVSVNKGVTIQGKGNAAATVAITPAAGVNAFTFAAAGDNAIIKGVSIIMTTAVSAKAIVVSSGCNGVTVDNCLIRGTTTLTTVTYIGILNSGSDLTVKDSRVLGMGVAPFQSGLGDRVKLVNSQFTTHTIAGVGIDLTTGDSHIVSGCDIVTSSTTASGIGIRVGSAAASFGTTLSKNTILGIATTPIHAVAGTVFSAQNAIGTTATATTTLSVFIG